MSGDSSRKQRVVLLLICLKHFLAIDPIKSLEMLHFFNSAQKIAAFKQNEIASKTNMRVESLMDKLTIILRAPVLASLPTCSLGYGGRIRWVHLVDLPESRFICHCWNCMEEELVFKWRPPLLCVFPFVPDGEEAPSVYIWPFCPGSVTPHQGQLPWNDWRNYLSARTKDPGRFGQTNLVSWVKGWSEKKERKKWFIFTASIYCNNGTVSPTSSN